MTTPTLILGSASPRRKEILSFFSIPFRQVASDFDEDTIAFEGDPRTYASRLAQAKGESLVKNYPNEIILTADTVVYSEGKNYLKPRDNADGFRMLTELSGKTHSVFTAVSVCRGEEAYVDVEETKVTFHALSPEQIRLYYTHIHCHDKAGGYAIQEAGGIIVREIKGCYYNVIGLPINALQKLLKQVDLDLWHHLK